MKHMSDTGHDIAAPSPWVRRHADLIRVAGRVLDVASGRGRHTRWLADSGRYVDAVDRDAEALQALQDVPRVQTLHADLEAESWPFDQSEVYDAVVVTNYLFRPRFSQLLDLIKPGGVLIYETFMVGNERFGKPANPDFLLMPGELLKRVDARFTPLAFEQGEVVHPKRAMLQRICAIRTDADSVELPRIG